MTKLKRILLALLLALTLFINAHKPSDHEHLAESPTERYYEIAIRKFSKSDANKPS